MTLLSICTDALDEIGQHVVPTTIAANADPTAERLLAAANRAGRKLALEHDWQALQTVHTFATENGTLAYARPSDYRKMAYFTQWDRTNFERIHGPMSPSEWQTLNSSSVLTDTVDRYWRFRADKFEVYPTPTTADTIAYEYYSTDWCDDSGGTGQDKFQADDDVPNLDEELLILAVIYRFLKSRGEPYAEEKGDYDDYLSTLLANDKGLKTIRFDRSIFRDDGLLLPETGYGA